MHMITSRRFRYYDPHLKYNEEGNVSSDLMSPIVLDEINYLIGKAVNEVRLMDVSELLIGRANLWNRDSN